MERGDGYWDNLKSYFDQDALAEVGVTNLAAFAKRYPTVRDYVAPNAEGLLRVDGDAQAMQLYPGSHEFFDRAIADLARPGNEAERARRMLERYAPEGASSRGMQTHKHGLNGGGATRTISSSERRAAIGGISTRWPRRAACGPTSCAGRRGRAVDSGRWLTRSCRVAKTWGCDSLRAGPRTAMMIDRCHSRIERLYRWRSNLCPSLEETMP